MKHQRIATLPKGMSATTRMLSALHAVGKFIPEGAENNVLFMTIERGCTQFNGTSKVVGAVVKIYEDNKAFKFRKLNPLLPPF